MIAATLAASNIARRSAANENTVRRLLQRWVSELEPVVCFDRQGEILGLTFKGGDRVILSVDDL